MKAVSILRKVEEGNFTIVSNEMIQNPNMSNKARGLYVYMLSMPDDWQFCIADLVNRSTDGREGIKSQMAELEELGYIKRGVQSINADGTFGTTPVMIRSSMDLPWPDEAVAENPSTDPDPTVAENPSTENPLTENPRQQRTHSTKNPETKNPETNTSDKDPVLVVWEAYAETLRKFDHTVDEPRLTRKRRELIKRRLNEFDVDALVKAVTGWVHSDWHRGLNPDGKIYNSLGLILRDDDKIEQFIGYHSVRRPPKPGDVNSAHGRDRTQRKGPKPVILSDDDEDFLNE